MVSNLGKTIKEIRKLKKIKQKDFANLIGVSERTLLNYERGNTIPSINKLHEISEILGISPNLLLNTVEGKRVQSSNDNIVWDEDEFSTANRDLVSDEWSPELYKEMLESSFINYIKSLIALSNNSNLKSVHFTSEDYEKLIKYCNNTTLNILDLYYQSNPIVFDLEGLNIDKRDDINE